MKSPYPAGPVFDDVALCYKLRRNFVKYYANENVSAAAVRAASTELISRWTLTTVKRLNCTLSASPFHRDTTRYIALLVKTEVNVISDKTSVLSISNLSLGLRYVDCAVIRAPWYATDNAMEDGCSDDNGKSRDEQSCHRRQAFEEARPIPTGTGRWRTI